MANTNYYSDIPFFGGISQVVSTLTANTPQLGTRITYDGKQYVYVYNGGNSQINPGYGICPQSGCTSYTGTITSVAYGLFHGVVQHSTLTTSTYGWVQYKGIAQVHIGSSTAQGTAITVGADGVFATYVCGTTGKECGWVVSASSGSTAQVTAYIAC
jgi:hypothetical protein